MVEHSVGFRHESELHPHSTDRLPLVTVWLPRCHSMPHATHATGLREQAACLHANYSVSKSKYSQYVTDNMYIIGISYIVNE